MRMPKKPVWKIYFAIYLLQVVTNLHIFFAPDSVIFRYYQTLIAYHISFIFSYGLNALSLILNALTLVPLYLFIADRQVLSQQFWGYLLVFRLVADVLGNSHQTKVLQAAFYEDPNTAWLMLGILVTLTLPSYIALFIYAFRRKN